MLKKVKIIKKEEEYGPRVFEQDENGEYTQELTHISSFSWVADVSSPNLIHITLVREVSEVDALVERMD